MYLHFVVYMQGASNSCTHLCERQCETPESKSVRTMLALVSFKQNTLTMLITKYKEICLKFGNLPKFGSHFVRENRVAFYLFVQAAFTEN